MREHEEQVKHLWEVASNNAKMLKKTQDYLKSLKKQISEVSTALNAETRTLTETEEALLKGALVDIKGLLEEMPQPIRTVGTKTVSKVGKLRGNRNTKSVITSPGSLVLKVAEFLCTKKVYERVFLQAVLDMRGEYNEALSSGRKEKAQWVLIRSYLALTWSVTLQVIEFLLSGPAKIIKTLWS
jgi:hypothetical protein